MAITSVSLILIPVLKNEESEEVLDVFLLLGECELTFAKLTVFEMNGDLLNAIQIAFHHQFVSH